MNNNTHKPARPSRYVFGNKRFFGDTAAEVNAIAHTSPDKTVRDALFRLKTYLVVQSEKHGEVRRIVPVSPRMLAVNYKGSHAQRKTLHVPASLYFNYSSSAI